MMKTVVFVCLLSLSLCLSQPTSPLDAHPTPTQAASPKADDKASPMKHEETPATVATVVKVVTIPADKPSEHSEKASPPVSPNETKPIDEKAQNKTEDKTPEKVTTKPNESKPEEPAKKDESKTKPAEGAITMDLPKTTEQSKAAGESALSTVKPATEKPTETPKDTTEKPLVGKRGFDGPSFIGGIILTLGLLAIGFMGFKYYKNQTERNYHTL